MIELILFIFFDIENKIGKFYVLDQVFPTYEHCQMFVEEKVWQRHDIGLTYCTTLDTKYKLSYDVGVISNW
jgi:hypothetical protein